MLHASTISRDYGEAHFQNPGERLEIAQSIVIAHSMIIMAGNSGQDVYNKEWGSLSLRGGHSISQLLSPTTSSPTAPNTKALY
jgi:hypothetical protein